MRLRLCGSFGAVCELEWVKGFQDDGVDVSHDQPFKALHGYRHEWYGLKSFRQVTFVYLGTGTMVVCLKISVKTLASWSENALSIRHGNPSGPAAL